MVYRGTTVFCPIFGFWRGPDGVRTGSGRGPASQGPKWRAPQPGSGAWRGPLAGSPGRVRQGPAGSEVPKSQNSAKRGQKCQKSYFLTIFEAEMRFFIFERFVNPARDAFPSWFLWLILTEKAQRESKRSRKVVDVKTKTRNLLIVPWENHSK